MSGRRIGYVDVTLRDGHQSLWATRMTNAMILPFVSRMDEMGFDWINLEGGAVFDVCVRFLREDPWERMRLVAAKVHKTPIDIMTRGQSLFTFRFYADDVVELAVRRIAANGMSRVTIYDALNDTRNLALSARTAKSEGMHVCAGLVYTVSPVHTDAYYQEVARGLLALGADSILIKDPAGLLVPDRVKSLVPALKSTVGDVPLELHSHSLSGMAEPCYLEAARLGVDILHTASHPLASGASLPPTEYCVRHLAREGLVSDVSLSDLAEMEDYFTSVAQRHGFPPAVPHRFDPDLYRHQVPGGMISNLRSDLVRMGMQDRLDQILEEAAQVRVDLGYPILVSPFAQFIVTQAMLNVLEGRRYKTVPTEVQLYLLGGYGRLPGKPVPELVDRAIAELGQEPIEMRPGERIPPALPAVRRERGPFDSDDDLVLAACYTDAELAPLFAARPWMPTPAGGSPLIRLLSELVAADLREVSINGNGLRLSLRR